MTATACADCLRRTWLLGRLSGHLDPVRGRIGELLALADDELIAAVAGDRIDDIRRDHDRFDAAASRAGIARAGLEAACPCASIYPAALRELAAPPAVLHVLGGLGRLQALLAEQPVSIVGARRPSPYGRSVARSLGRGLGSAGVTVVSGMALGIDSAAHLGALDGDGATLAVLPAGADRAYPATARALHRRIPQRGAIVSELAPGTTVRRWMFPARNRIIAALGAMTVIVQARAGSGSLVTARWATELRRAVGAVPGEVGSPLSVGPHRLLRGGAELVSDAQDVLDALFGVGIRTAGAVVTAGRREALEPGPRALLEALAEGSPPAAAFARAGLEVDGGLAALAALELGGWVRREPGGRYSLAR